MREEKLNELAGLLASVSRVAVLTGAGISAESGIPTFRGEQGLWKQFRAEELATPEAFERDPRLVWEWYDWRRKIIGQAAPNAGHRILAAWQGMFSSFSLITQNIDGLHERAGSRDPLELHGCIWKVRCLREGTLSENRDVPLRDLPPLCPDCGGLLRPHVVWFGEPLDSRVLDEAFRRCSSCQVMFVVGTSAVVHPAAALPLAAAEAGAVLVEVNPEPTPLTRAADFSFRGESGSLLPLLNRKLAAPDGP
ncbi:MAG: NAD-dependent deacylase [Candidatus Aminicenantes bacterium RBG_13_62_12]|nr:MAG: NAD-dependent deacylase [Candidatus Aminicenantes bacterium RBG_13_62_12]